MHRQRGWMAVWGGVAALLAAVLVVAAASAAETPACVPLARIEPVSGAGARPDRRTGGAADGPLRYSAAVRDEIYPAAAPVDVALTVRNAGPSAVALSFATAQRFDVVLFDDTCREIWRWSRGRMFAQVLGGLTIAPGNIVTYRIRWDQRDQHGRRVGRGAYEARVVFLGRRSPGAPPVVLSPLEFAVR
jgi:hypothetical protein